MKFYRYEEVNYHQVGIKIFFTEFDLLKETPCGYWIYKNYTDDKRWVSKTAKKRFAYPSQDEALSSFIARKTRQIQILEAQLINAKSALVQGKNEWTKLKNSESQ
jgi:hypothetical protein